MALYDDFEVKPYISPDAIWQQKNSNLSRVKNMELLADDLLAGDIIPPLADSFWNLANDTVYSKYLNIPMESMDPPICRPWIEKGYAYEESALIP